MSQERYIIYLFHASPKKVFRPDVLLSLFTTLFYLPSFSFFIFHFFYFFIIIYFFIFQPFHFLRIHGVRVMIAEKNIGRRVYSINQLQAQFLPLVYRPPKEVLEDLLRKDDT